MSSPARSRSGVVIIAALGVLLLSLLSFSVWDREAPIEWLRDTPPLAFFAVMAALPLVGVPLLPLFVLAGSSFGVWLGTGGALVALAVHLVAAWGIGTLFRPALTRWMARTGAPWVVSSGGRSPLRVALAVKLTPGVPAILKHYGLVVAGVPFAPYFLVSMGTTGATGVLAVVVGGSLFDHRWHAPALVVALASALLAAWIWQRRARVLSDEVGTGDAAAATGSPAHAVPRTPAPQST